MALEGPVVVLAGAGTGKTRTMTHRIAYGVAIGAFPATGVLALTFTTRAAGELRARLRGLQVPAVQARTFHSAALRQAQYFWPQVYGGELPPVEGQRTGMISAALRRQGLVPETGLIRDIAAEISWAKVTNVSPEDYAQAAPAAGRVLSGRTVDEVARVLTHYESVKTARGVIDFDDILLCAAGLLADNPQVAGEVRRTYRHFVVDEYQDVSPLQQTLLDLWRGDSLDVCVVGDPAQTIHSFAGAQATYLTSFHRRHPTAQRIELVRDYRSTPEVVGLANQIMAGQGTHVELQSARPSGPAPLMQMAASEATEADEVAGWLQQRFASGIAWNQMAVLYRIHAQSPVLEAALAEAGIPFVTRGSDGFFERPEVRAALRALAAAPTTADQSPADALRAVLAGLGWTPEPPQGQGSLRERWESWDALAGVATDFETRRPEATGAELVEELSERAHQQHSPDGQGVTLSTLHAAKGLEWDVVAIVGAHEGGLPFVLATTEAAVAEERRLFYVGVTRAREHLRISGSVTRSGTGARRGASRFLPGLSNPAPRGRQHRRRRGRGTVLSRRCHACGELLASSLERKLGRHDLCAASVDEQLWEDLRAWRKEQAEAGGVPAFVVFSDATLLAIAEQRPASRDSLATVSGVGLTKLDRYGDGILHVLGQHPAE